jgi:glutamate-1-semialdehyde 2,1-aminomutase
MNRIPPKPTGSTRAARCCPPGGFGNFDPGIVIARGEGARVWDEDGANMSTT